MNSSCTQGYSVSMTPKQKDNFLKNYHDRRMITVIPAAGTFATILLKSVSVVNPFFSDTRSTGTYLCGCTIIARNF